jgi:hypothetical protein
MAGDDAEQRAESGVSGAAAARLRGSARYEAPPMPRAPRASEALMSANSSTCSRRSMFRPNSLAVSISAWPLSEIFASFISTAYLMEIKIANTEQIFTG